MAVRWCGNTGIPATVYNIGHSSPVKLLDFIYLLEKNFGKTAQKEFVNMQPGDVHQTWADTTHLEEDYGYRASTPLEEGIKKFVTWYNSYYQWSNNSIFIWVAKIGKTDYRKLIKYYNTIYHKKKSKRVSMIELAIYIVLTILLYPVTVFPYTLILLLFQNIPPYI